MGATARVALSYDAAAERARCGMARARVAGVNVWLWDAGMWCGVALGRDEALTAAALCLIAGDADTAKVEPASMAFDRYLQPAYARLGAGWTASRNRNGSLKWEPFGGIAVLPNALPAHAALGRARP
jgi:hypothetical protein